MLLEKHRDYFYLDPIHDYFVLLRDKSKTENPGKNANIKIQENFLSSPLLVHAASQVSGGGPVLLAYLLY